ITHNFYDYNGVTYTNLFESLMLIESLTICPEIIEIMNANWRGCSLALEEDIWMEHLSELEIIYISSEQTELDFVKLILMRSPVLKKFRVFISKNYKDVEMQISEPLLSAPRASPVNVVICSHVHMQKMLLKLYFER
ncbi:hypothetical protein Tco_1513935, partial [Tanacetum coccineum]